MQVRGSLLSPIPKLIQKKFGEDALGQWLAKISHEARELYLNSIDQKEWYPLRQMLIEPFANVAQLFYKWDLKAAAWDFGRASADMRFWGPTKALMKIPSPNFFISKGVEYLKSYYDPCSLEIKENGDKRCVMRILEFPEPDNTVEYRICGWVQRGLEICGCKDVALEIPRSLTRFDPYTEFVVTWK